MASRSPPEPPCYWGSARKAMAFFPIDLDHHRKFRGGLCLCPLLNWWLDRLNDARWKKEELPGVAMPAWKNVWDIKYQIFPKSDEIQSDIPRARAWSVWQLMSLKGRSTKTRTSPLTCVYQKAMHAIQYMLFSWQTCVGCDCHLSACPVCLIAQFRTLQAGGRGLAYRQMFEALQKIIGHQEKGEVCFPYSFLV